MKRIMVLAFTVALAMLVIAYTAGAFTSSEKQVINALRARITSLEASVTQLQSNDIGMASDINTLDANGQQMVEALSALDIRVDTLEEELPPFAFSNITATPLPCSGTSCSADIAWNVTPGATGQVLYGLTDAYGSKSTLETDLLCYHKQRISGLKPDTIYHYSIRATDGVVGGAQATLELSS